LRVFRLQSKLHRNNRWKNVFSLSEVISETILIETVGWLSTLLFLISIIEPSRIRLHEWGMLTSIATGIYGYAHGATAIWIKWILAFFFHFHMLLKIKREKIRQNKNRPGSL
jgi:hypothetical protein